MRRILTVTFSNQKFAPGGMNPRGNPDCRVLRWQNRIKDTDQTTKYPSMSEEVTMQAGEPSHTARGAAAYRAIHQTLEGGAIFSDPFASKILDDETRARLDETAADPSLRPMRLFIAARSRFSEETLAACVARGVRQIGRARSRPRYALAAKGRKRMQKARSRRAKGPSELKIPSAGKPSGNLSVLT